MFHAKNLLIWATLTASMGGCSDDKADAERGAGQAGQTSSGGSAGKAGAPADAGQPSGGSSDRGPAYGIGSLVTIEEGSNDYLVLVPELDLGGELLDLKQAREFSGQSDLASHDGAVLVATGDAPEIVSYEVDADLALHEGGSVSFANFGLTSAAFWNNQFVADDKAYMVNGASELIIWNPRTLQLEGTIALPELESRPGLRVVTGLADRASVVHDGKLYLPLYWTDERYAQRSDDSVVVVVDIASDSVLSTIPVDCPGLDYATVDDDGLLYFSNWTGGPGVRYVLGTAQNCVAAIDPKTETVTTKTFASITGGHEGAAFKYAGGGRFVLSVFDEVRADVENADDPFVPVAGTNWQLWSYDPASGSAVPIEDVDWNSGAIIHSQIDGQLYSMVPGADYASTVVYAVTGIRAESVFGVTGWSFRLFKVR